MNLTVKRIITGLAVIAGVVTLAAYGEGDNGNGNGRTLLVESSFEEATEGDPASTYQADDYSSGALTNYLWESSSEDDASVIVATEDQTGYNLVRPLADEAGGATKHLKLETESATLTRYIEREEIDSEELGEGEVFGKTKPVPVAFGSGLYVDTMIKFVPGEDDPDLEGSGVKLGLYVNANSNLVVYHIKLDEFFAQSPVPSVFEDITINPDKWYRLTIQLGELEELASCKIFLDQAPLTHQNALTDGLAAGGDWFVMGINEELNITSVAFQGNGALDEFVVATEVYGLGTTPSSVLLTLTWDNTILSVVNVDDDDAPITKGTDVESGTTIKITAKDWFRVTSVASEESTFEYSGTTGDDVTESTGIVSANAAAEVTITGTKLTGSLQLGDVKTDIGPVADWAITYGKSETEVGTHIGDWLEDYLLKVEPGRNGAIVINSITVADGVATVVVGAELPPADGGGGAEVDFSDLNGDLVIYGADSLDSEFVRLGSEEVNLKELGETATIEVAIENGKSFYRAAVELQLMVGEGDDNGGSED